MKNPYELLLILRITGFVMILPGLIRFNSIQDVVRKITPAKGRVIRRPLTLDRVIYLCGRVLRIFQRHRYNYSCLKRSLLLYHFLRYYQVPVEIGFGVKWMDDDLTGHSWLILHGDVYLEPAGKAEQFTRFIVLPAGSAGELSSLEDISFD